jgi:hypothetical protein
MGSCGSHVRIDQQERYILRDRQNARGFIASTFVVTAVYLNLARSIFIFAKDPCFTPDTVSTLDKDLGRKQGRKVVDGMSEKMTYNWGWMRGARKGVCTFV